MGIGPDRELAAARSCPTCGRGCEWALGVARRHGAAAAVRAGRAGRRWWRSACSSRCGSSPRRSRSSCSACATRRRAASRPSSPPIRPRGTAWSLAHLGIAVFIIGVTLVKGYGIEQNVTLDIGQSVTVRRLRIHVPRRRAGHRAQLSRAWPASSRCAATASCCETLRPEKRIYNASGIADDRGRDRRRASSATATSRSANRSPTRATAGAWGVRVYIKPFVDWIWGGCFLMALGGFIAMTRPPLSPCRQAEIRRAGRRGARRAEHHESAALPAAARASSSSSSLPVGRACPRPARGALAARRQARARVQARAVARRRTSSLAPRT